MTQQYCDSVTLQHHNTGTSIKKKFITNNFFLHNTIILIHAWKIIS